MGRQSVREPAVAGAWYPAEADALAREVDGYLGSAASPPAGAIAGLVAPHAGLRYSGPVAGWSYRCVDPSGLEVIVVAGPSHYVAFDGVALDDRDAYATPLGPLRLEGDTASAIVEGSPLAAFAREPHAREHAIELQLPFLRRRAPDTPIVPIVMGRQTRACVDELARVLAAVLSGRRALLVASTDLSHFFDAGRAEHLDARVAEHVERFDADGLMDELERYPEHDRGRFVACGGGPAVAVMRAARALGAVDGRVLHRSDSAAVSGDRESVVGYMAAAFGCFG